MADDSDDLLDPDEIEKLLSGAAPGGGGAPDPGPTNSGSEEPGTPEESPLLDAGDIEALLRQRDEEVAESQSAIPNPAAEAEQLMDQAEAGLAAAIAPDLGSAGIPADLGETSPFEYQDLSGAASSRMTETGLKALQDVELDLRIELGRTELLIEEVLKLAEGSVVPLDKLAGDPVDIMVNGRLIARGEVLVLNDNFCVRVAEILTPDF